MRSPRLLPVFVLLTLATAACGGPADGARVVAAPPASPAAFGAAAPAKIFAVGVRRLALHRGADRALPTTVWYPTTGASGGSPRLGADPAPGRFPIVLFSHGLHGMPDYYQSITIRWASAGFVVAAPEYPHTNDKAARFDRNDVRNQPADAAYVIGEIVALGTRTSDALFGHIDGAHVAAGGHSAGGYTTVGLFTGQRDARLRCGIVIAGGRLGDAGFVGAAAPMLFVHGDADPTVSYATGRAAYDRVPWPKAFLTLLKQGHGEYLTPGLKGFEPTIQTTTDFLRWTLYGDAAALERISADGTESGVSRISNRL